MAPLPISISGPLSPPSLSPHRTSLPPQPPVSSRRVAKRRGGGGSSGGGRSSGGLGSSSSSSGSRSSSGSASGGKTASTGPGSSSGKASWTKYLPGVGVGKPNPGAKLSPLPGVRVPKPKGSGSGSGNGIFIPPFNPPAGMIPGYTPNQYQPPLIVAPPAPSVHNKTDDEQSSGVKRRMMMGAVFGGFVSLVLLVFLVLYCLERWKRWRAMKRMRREGAGMRERMARERGEGVGRAEEGDGGKVHEERTEEGDASVTRPADVHLNGRGKKEDLPPYREFEPIGCGSGSGRMEWQESHAVVPTTGRGYLGSPNDTIGDPDRLSFFLWKQSLRNLMASGTAHYVTPSAVDGDKALGTRSIKDDEIQMLMGKLM